MVVGIAWSAAFSELPAFAVVVHGIPSWSEDDEDDLALDLEIVL